MTSPYGVQFPAHLVQAGSGERKRAGFAWNGLSMVGLVCLLLSGCANPTPPDLPQSTGGIWNDDPTIQIDLRAAEQRLRQGLREGTVSRLVVLQMDRKSVFRLNVSSSSLEQNYDYRLDHRRVEATSVGTNFLAALTQACPVPSAEVADLRWGFIFCKRDGTRVFSAYCDATGKRGVIEGACFSFEEGSLAVLADSLFPDWMK